MCPKNRAETVLYGEYNLRKAGRGKGRENKGARLGKDIADALASAEVLRVLRLLLLLPILLSMGMCFHLLVSSHLLLIPLFGQSLLFKRLPHLTPSVASSGSQVLLSVCTYLQLDVTSESREVRGVSNPNIACNSGDLGLIPGLGRTLEKVNHSGILAWRIPWTEKLDGLLSTGSQRVGHSRATEHIL